MAGEEFIERRQFLAALREKQRVAGRGFQKQLAGNTGYSDSYINQMIKGKRGLSFKAQVKIAKALGYGYADFLELGKVIMGGTVPAEMKTAAPSPDAEYWKDKFISCYENLDKALKEIDKLRGEIAELRERVDRLTAPPTSAEDSGVA